MAMRVVHSSVTFGRVCDAATDPSHEPEPHAICLACGVDVFPEYHGLDGDPCDDCGEAAVVDVWHLFDLMDAVLIEEEQTRH